MVTKAVEKKAKALFATGMDALPASYRQTLVEWEYLPYEAKSAWFAKAQEIPSTPDESDVRAYYEGKQSNILPRHRHKVGLVAWDDLSDADKAVWAEKFQRGE